MHPRLFNFGISDATHIFDGLNDFPTHVAHMRFGSFVVEPTSWPMSSDPRKDGFANSSLYTVALQWLKEDREHRIELERQGEKKQRGARRDEVPEICLFRIRIANHCLAGCPN
jgi:CCR4-NOT complex subunit CAF16